MPRPDATLIKVRFELDASDWHGRPSESLWAAPLDGATAGSAFQLCNSPFFVCGVSYLDIVRATPSMDGSEVLEFSGVIDRSGHSTYMLLVPVVSADFDEFWAKLQTLGCTYESTTIGTSLGERYLYSVDVAETADIHAVYAVLEEAERANIWIFQEGHVGHKV